MKRMVHITSSLQRGGAETVLDILLSQLNQYHHEVIYFHDGAMRLSIEAKNITTHKISGKFFLYDPWFFVSLYRVIKIIKPDVIHSLLWSANFCARLIGNVLNVPVICAVHAHPDHEGSVRTFIDRVVPLNASYYIAVAPHIAHPLQYHKKIDDARICVIRNGISIPTQITKPDNNLFTIGAVGRLVPVKNFAFLIQSFASLAAEYPDWRLMIIGSGPLENDFEKLIEQLSLQHRVQLIKNACAKDYYNFFDCFVQVSRSEGLSIALLEALGYQLPVVVTGKNKQHDVINHGEHGFIIDHNDTHQLSSFLNLLYRDKQRRTSMGKAGRLLVEKNYCAATMANNYGQLFETAFMEAQHLQDKKFIGKI